MPGRRTLGGLLALALLLALVHLAGLARGGWRVLDGELSGTDTYMRLVRVERLAETGAWYDSTIPRANTPYGQSLHWTRPFDLVLLAGAALLAPALGFESGLYAAAVLVGPLLHFLTLLALLWGSAGLLRRPAWFAMAAMYLLQASVTAQFLAGQADHHGLQALLYTLLLGASLRLVAAPSARLAALAGLVAALAVWVSVEGLLIVALVAAVLAVAWILGGPRYLAAGLGFALAAAGGLVLALALERPPADWGLAQYDRLSIAQLTAFLAHAALWLGLWLWPGAGGRTRPWVRAATLAVGGALALALTLALYPKLAAGPMVEVLVRVRQIWLPQISEMLSILAEPAPARQAYLLLLYLGAALPAGAYMVWLVGRRRGPEQALWTVLLAATGGYLALALVQLRWGIYAQLAALPAYGALLQATLDRFGLALDGRSRLRRRLGGLLLLSLGRLAVLLVFGAGFAIAAWAVKPSGEAVAGAPGLVQACDLARIGRALAAPDGLGRRPRRILSYIFDGPELLYRTPHAVVGTPYHGNGAGILDTYDVFAARAPEAARRIVARRGIDWVLLCPHGSERLLYAGAGDGTTLLERLERGEPPAWLRPLALPPASAGEYLLFEVRG